MLKNQTTATRVATHILGQELLLLHGEAPGEAQVRLVAGLQPALEQELGLETLDPEPGLPKRQHRLFSH
jgi:hypothetical protein